MIKSCKNIFLAFIALFLILPPFLTSCENVDSGIPNYPVYIKRYIYDIPLIADGSYLYVDKTEFGEDRIGYGGILVVKAYDGFYYAFDIACTNEKSASIHISKPDGTLKCKCESCGEEYDLSFGLGTPTKGISNVPLKRYNVAIDDWNYIVVTP
jgi:hypothetical protein